MIKISPRKKEVLLTVITNLLLQVITALCGFVLPPLVIKVFGSSVNGMVSSITQFIAYLNIVEAGVGGASIAALYKPLAHGDTAERNSILSATAQFYNRSGVLFTVLVCMLAFVYPLIVGGEVDRLQSSLMVLVLGITGAAEFFLIGKYRVLLTADKKMYVLSFVQMGGLIISTGLAILLIRNGIGILPVKLCSAMVYLGRYVLLSLYVHRKYKNIDFHAVPDTQAISQSKNVLVHQICSLIVLYSPMVIITIFCSLKDASIYTVYLMVFNAVNLLLGAFSNGMQSFFGESLVISDLEDTRKSYRNYETLYFIITFFIYSMTYILIMPFMKIYTKSMTDCNYIQPVLSIMLVISGILSAIRNPTLQLAAAANRYKETQIQALIESILNLVSSIIFVSFFGFIGVVIGGICSGLYRTGISIVYTYRKILFVHFVKSILSISVIFLLFVPFCFFAQRILPDGNSYFAWFLEAIVSGGLCFIPCFLCFFYFIRKRKAEA